MNKILLDTQAFIWFYESNPFLSQKARATIEKTENDCFVSMATFWEMSIKMNLGKLNVKGLSLQEFMDEVDEHRFFSLAISRQHILENEKLPLHHRDPFDRILISQAIVENWPIISSDDAFDNYQIQRIW